MGKVLEAVALDADRLPAVLQGQTLQEYLPDGRAPIGAGEGDAAEQAVEPGQVAAQVQAHLAQPHLGHLEVKIGPALQGQGQAGDGEALSLQVGPAMGDLGQAPAHLV